MQPGFLHPLNFPPVLVFDLQLDYRQGMENGFWRSRGFSFRFGR
jgi:hypothetical protein